MANDTNNNIRTEAASEQAKLRRKRDERRYNYYKKDKKDIFSKWGFAILCVVVAIILLLCFVTRMLIVD